MVDLWGRQPSPLNCAVNRIRFLWAHGYALVIKARYGAKCATRTSSTQPRARNPAFGFHCALGRPDGGKGDIPD